MLCLPNQKNTNICKINSLKAEKSLVITLPSDKVLPTDHEAGCSTVGAAFICNARLRLIKLTRSVALPK